MRYFSERPRVVFFSVAGLFGVLDAWGHLHAYITFAPLDVMTHFLFGFGLALAVIHFFGIRNGMRIFVLVTVAGVSWECIEFIYDHALAFPYGFPISQHGIGDTLLDLFSSSVGALLSIQMFLSHRDAPSTISVQELPQSKAQ